GAAKRRRPLPRIAALTWSCAGAIVWLARATLSKAVLPKSAATTMAKWLDRAHSKSNNQGGVMNHNDPRDGLSRRDFVRVLTAGAVVMGAAALGSAGVARAADGAQPIEFMSKGLRCRGLKYVPAGLKSGEKRPCIVLAHGFSAVKEMYFTDYAEAFSKAGYVAVVFDYRYQGE